MTQKVINWGPQLVGKILTNSHFKELGIEIYGKPWLVEILYVGKHSFFGREFGKESTGENFEIEQSYGFRQFDWEFYNPT